jgi:hypothetical protein
MTHEWRRARIATARLSFDASLPRTGRVERQILRCFAAGDYGARTMTELLRWVYPALDRHECSHRWSVRRALLKIATPIGRSPTGRGRPGIWQLPVP